MQKKTIIDTHKNIFKGIHQHKLWNVFSDIETLIEESGKEFFSERIEKHRNTYENILKHSFGEYKDPERYKIYNYLLRDLLEISDELTEVILTDNSSDNVHAVKKQLERSQRLERKEAIAYLEVLTFNNELSGLLQGIKIEGGQAEISREEALVKVFNIIWLADKYTESENQLLNSVCKSRQLYWYDKSLIVSALTLSLLRYFDVGKFQLLAHFVLEKENYVWQRALVGLFFAFLKYHNRYQLYPALEEVVKQLKTFDNIERNIETILIQFTKTRETERVSKKWKEDILPRMSRIRPKIEQKLDLENIFKDEFGEEKNPDWETVFEDAPDLLDKLQEFTEMQMEGMDVFMSAFSQLKNYPFFHKISNWFLPFYHQNQYIQPFLKPQNSELDLTPLVKRIEETHFMCNSDKYSFSINLGMIPEDQRNALMKMTSAEMESLSEIEKGEGLINDFAKVKSIYTQYFQDLYRFYKLHPWKNEFEDVFLYDPDVFENPFIQKLMSDSRTVRNIAEFYFDKKFYNYALKIFISLLERESSNVELFEKIAYCYEKTGDFENALDYYKRADLIETNRLWIVQKMAFCSKYLNNWSQALLYYRQAEKQKPDDLKIQANIGQCLIYLERYEEALDYYFKIEVLAPENNKIRRPLAWCSFILGKWDVARDYLMRLLENDPSNQHDLMNLGHVFWCMNEEKNAVEYYAKSMKAFKDPNKFENSFREDKKHLLKHGISELDMDLMLEYIK
ncbi:MAG: tetratricopeptide repeat protein [Bacteroidales bacterium]